MKENRMVSPFHERPLKVGDWVWVNRSKTGMFNINPVVGPARVAGIEGRKILVEFPEKNPVLHHGGINRPERCWFVSVADIEPLPMDFCIFRNAGTTYCLRGDKRRVTGKAKFSTVEGEDYNPLIGAVIAMARAYGQDPTAVALKVLKVFSAIPQPPVKTVAAAGLEQRINDLAEQVDFLNDWCASLTDRCDELAAKVEPKKKQLVIKHDGELYGVVGTPTKYKTLEGKALCVGDQVKINPLCGGYDSEALVVETEEDGAFIMGLCAICNPATGATRGWELRAKKSDPLQVGPLKVGLNEFTVIEEEVEA